MFKWQKAAVKVPFRKGKKKKKFQTSRRKQKIINEKKKIVKKIVLRVNSQKIKTAQNTGTVNPSLPQRLFLVSIFFLPPTLPPLCVYNENSLAFPQPAHTSVYTGSRQSDMLLKGQDGPSPYREICAVSCGALSSPPL